MYYCCQIINKALNNFLNSKQNNAVISYMFANQKINYQLKC